MRIVSRKRASLGPIAYLFRSAWSWLHVVMKFIALDLIRQRILASSRPPGRWPEGIFKVDSVKREEGCGGHLEGGSGRCWNRGNYAHQEDVVSCRAAYVSSPRHCAVTSLISVLLICPVIDCVHGFAAGTLSRGGSRRANGLIEV
jgi:hypothetical protein